jgi:zinc transporter 1/2/3
MHYEATAAALVMAGLFVTFLLEFLVHHVLGRKVEHHADTKDVAQVESATSDGPEDIVVTPSSVSVMEAGIVFHSVCTCHRFFSRKEQL